MLYAFLYVIISGFSFVFIEKLYADISPFFSLLIMSIITTIFFNLVNIHNLKKMYVACWQEKKLWFGIMVVILVMWSCTMIGPGLIGASLYGFIYFSFLGVLGYLSAYFRREKLDRNKLYFSFAIFLLIVTGIIDLLREELNLSSIFGLALGLIGGITSFIYFKQTQMLVKRVKLSASQILAIRFYLTIITMFIILPKGNFDLYLTWNNMWQLLGLSFFSLIIPLYFMQKALEKITSEQSAIILSLVPACAGIIQEIMLHNVELKFVIIYVLYFLCVFWSYWLDRRKAKTDLSNITIENEV